MRNKMKKSLMIAIFFVGVILVTSFVFAGITGAVIKERSTQTLTAIDGGTYDVTLKEVYRDRTSKIIITDEAGKTETILVSEDGTATTSTGVQVRVTKVRTRFFSRPSAEVNLFKQPAPTPVEAGEQTCQVCTESYKLEEAETINLNGESIFIDFIDQTQARLKVNGVNTALLSKWQTFQLNNGQVVTVKNIRSSDYVGGQRLVELCLSGCYKLEEAETISIKGDDVYIDFIDQTQARLKVNGVNTGLLSEGQLFELSNGQIATVKNIRSSDYVGGQRLVEFCLSSSY